MEKTTGILTVLVIAAVSGLTLALAPASAHADLIAIWKMDGDATDSSGNDYHALEQGSPGYVTGQIGQAISLNGANQYADPPNIGVYSQLSASVWVNCSDADHRGEMAIFHDRDTWQANPGTPHFFLYHTDAVTADDVYIDVGRDVATAVTASDPVQEGQWHHLSWTYDKNAAIPTRLYVDGGELANSGTSGNVGDLTLDDMLIGNGYNRYFPGKIDDVALYSRVLTLTQAKSLNSLGRSALNYNAAEAEQLFEAYSTDTPANIEKDDRWWAKTANLTGGEGIVEDRGNGRYALQLDPDGGGVMTIGVPGILMIVR